MTKARRKANPDYGATLCSRAASPRDAREVSRRHGWRRRCAGVEPADI